MKSATRGGPGAHHTLVIPQFNQHRPEFPKSKKIKNETKPANHIPEGAMQRHSYCCDNSHTHNSKFDGRSLGRGVERRGAGRGQCGAQGQVRP